MEMEFKNSWMEMYIAENGKKEHNMVLELLLIQMGNKLMENLKMAG